MSKEVTIWIVIGVYALFMLGIGVWYSRKGTDMAGFTVGGRNAGAWISALSYGTAYFSAVMFIGYSGGSGWSYGLWSVLVGVGNAVFGTLLAWLVLANRTRDITRRHDIKSMPQLFEKRFQSRGMRLFACVVIFVFLIPYSASVYKGLTSVCSVILGIDETVCMLIIAIASAVVLVLGGYMATLKADFVQGFIMMVGVAALIVLVVQSPQVGGLSQGLSNMVDYMESHQMAPLSGSSALALVSTVLMTSFGTWGLPQMVQKFYAIKNEKAIEKGTVISTLFAVVVAGGCYFLGGFGRLFDIDVKTLGYDAIIPKMLENLPDLLIAVVILLVLSASMSTLSSLVLTSSSTLTIDIIKPASKKMTERTQLSVMRVLIAVFIIISAVLAFVQYKLNISSIAQLMGISWGALAGAFLAPFIYGLYWKRATAAGCAASFVFGVGVMTANMIFRSYFPAILRSPVNCGAFVMLAGLVIVPVVSLLTKSPDRAKTDEMFSCYDTAVTGQAKEFLGD